MTEFKRPPEDGYYHQDNAKAIAFAKSFGDRTHIITRDREFSYGPRRATKPTKFGGKWDGADYALNREQSQHVWVFPNQSDTPKDEPRPGGPKKEDFTHIAAIVVDLDGMAPADAVAICDAKDIPYSTVVDSGDQQGTHLYIRLRNAIEATEDNVHKMRQVMFWLTNVFGTNPENGKPYVDESKRHIGFSGRCPGTWNAKPGKPARWCDYHLKDNGNRYSYDDIPAEVFERSIAKEIEGDATEVMCGDAIVVEDGSLFIEAGASDSLLAKMTDPEAAQRDGNRNSLASKFCTQAIYEGIQPELILGALLAPHLPISNHMYYHATGKPRSEGEVIAIARKKIKDAFKWVRAHPRSNHTKHETPTAQKDAVHGRAVGEILQQHQIKNLGGKDFAQFVGNHWATLTEQEQIRLFRSEGARWSYNVGNTEKAFIPTNRSDQEMLTELLNQTDELADQNPNFIPFKNGQLNTRNGELLPHAPKYTNRNVLDVSYDPADDKPQEFLTWLWHLTTSEMIKNADGSLRRWDMGRDPTRAMRRNMEIIGYILSGRSDLQILISWYATGGNGKGLLIELLENLLASGVVEISAHDLDPAKERFGLTDLIDARVVTLPELDNALSPGAFETVKKITANDKMKIKLHGKQGVQIRPNVVVLMTPNTRPRLSGTVQAIERRFEAFAYNGAFRTEKDPRKVSAFDPFVVPQDPNYIDKLLVERGAIVNACITAFLARPGKFFTTTEETDQEADAVVYGNDAAKQFAADCVSYEADSDVCKDEVYDIYCQWHQDEYPERPIYSKTAFTQAMKKSGYVDRDRGGNRADGPRYVWQNVKVKSPEVPHSPHLSDGGDVKFLDDYRTFRSSQSGTI